MSPSPSPSHDDDIHDQEMSHQELKMIKLPTNHCNNNGSNGSLNRLAADLFNKNHTNALSPNTVTPSSSRNKRKNFKPRNICVYNDDEDLKDFDDDLEEEEQLVSNKRLKMIPHGSPTDYFEDNNVSIASFIPNISPIKHSSNNKNGNQSVPHVSDMDNSKPSEPGNLFIKKPCEQMPLDLRSHISDSNGSSPSPVASPTNFIKTPVPTNSMSTPRMVYDDHPRSSPSPSPGVVPRSTRDSLTEKGSLGFWRPGVISGIAPWIDPKYLSFTGKSLFEFEQIPYCVLHQGIIFYLYIIFSIKSGKICK